MRNADRNLIIGVVILCLIIGVLAPFIASSNPDGLEKSAEQLMGNPETEPVIESPFPDYTIEPFGKLGEIIAMAIGIFVTLIVAYIIAKLIGRRKNHPKAED
jgi:cobalt/nickel transport protein